MPGEHERRSGDLLEFGCGHGLFSIFLAAESASRRVFGCDIDRAKIAVAEQAAANLPVGNARFSAEAQSPFDVDEFDMVVVVDVFYLMARETQREVIETLVKRVKPGGRLLIKEMSTTPAWKYRWAIAQEMLAVKLARITMGETIKLVPPATYCEWLRELGMKVTEHPLDKGYLHPHHLICAHKP